jgi:hypothetical protein
VISSNYRSSAAHRQSKKQVLDYKIKELNLKLIRLVAERRNLIKEREALEREIMPRIPECPPPEKTKRPRLIGLTPEEKLERKRAYMRNYMRERKKLGAAFVLKHPQTKPRRTVEAQYD